MTDVVDRINEAIGQSNSVVDRVRDYIYDRRAIMQSDRARMAAQGAQRCDLIPDMPHAFMEVYVRLHYDTISESMVTGEDHIYRYKDMAWPYDPQESVDYQRRGKDKNRRPM